MAFYLDGNPTPNPTLRVRAGERINLVLRSEDAGMTHDFAITSWKVGTGFLNGKGSVSVNFQVPERADGPQEYVCSAHSVMMKGNIEVE
jgi:plastocyanin